MENTVVGIKMNPAVEEMGFDAYQFATALDVEQRRELMGMGHWESWNDFVELLQTRRMLLLKVSPSYYGRLYLIGAGADPEFKSAHIFVDVCTTDGSREYSERWFSLDVAASNFFRVMGFSLTDFTRGNEIS